MSLLHRHILWSVATTCLAAVAVFTAVMLLGNTLKDLLGYVMAGQISAKSFIELLGLLLTYAATYALPMGMLTGVLLVLGRMSASQEVTAMRAAGLSLGYIARPVVWLGVVATLGALVMNFEVMPRSRTAYKRIVQETVQTNPLSFIVPKTFIRDFPRVVLFVEEKQGTELRDLWIWQLDSDDRVRAFGRAQRGVIDYDVESAVLQVTLFDVAMEARNRRDPEDFHRSQGTSLVQELPIKLELDSVFGRQPARRKVDWFTVDELLAARDEAMAAGDPAAAMRVAMAISEKGATAVAVLAFAVIAISLGIKVSRRETSANLGVALALVMAYYFLTVIVGWLENVPAARPDLLMWVPALFFLGLGLWMFRRLGAMR